MTTQLELTQIKNIVNQALKDQPTTDLHTHCFAPSFGASPDRDGLLLWGIDELVTYHYLIAEVFRVVPASKLPYDEYWQMTKAQQADHIWQHLFVNNTPISEACRGVLTTLNKLGLDPNTKTLEPLRKWFNEQNPDNYVDKVMELANIDLITMTNEPFSQLEYQKWQADGNIASDSRFATVLRLDPLLCEWSYAVQRLVDWGYEVSEDFSGNTVEEAKRFLRDWIIKMNPLYIATSLPPEFKYPDINKPYVERVVRDILMPVLEETGRPWAMMIGSRRAVNPALRDAGDMGMKADVLSVANLCSEFPRNRFMVTMLSRENQHELAVTARKFGNLLIFGCWWFLNDPSLIEEITRMRIELLGTTFVPQHSDARILDQLVYKWEHSRQSIGKVLVEKYTDIAVSGFAVTEEHIKRDVALFMRDNFRNFCEM